MKKIILLGILIFLVSGCTSIKSRNLNELVIDMVSSNVKTTNVSRNGYRFYLPKGINIRESKGFNEILDDVFYEYYLYVDVVEYHNQTEFSYKTNSNAYYSRSLENNGKKGYIEINNYKNNQYLIEIMYNYAKIEVVVYQEDINHAVAYAMAVLTSITYNDNVIENYLSSSILNSNEEEFDIFEVIGRDQYLQVTDEEEKTQEKNDTDYIN